jgi:DNA-binding NarL/FixJ family response regulator
MDTTGSRALPQPLSRVESDVLSLLNGGLTNRQIADNLAMTEATTKWHMNQIFCKLHARNRVEAFARGPESSTPASPRCSLPPAGPMPERLRKTEVAILGLLNQGMTNHQIAEELGLTVGTTKWHLNQIFGKLQVRNRIGALVRARQLEWL